MGYLPMRTVLAGNPYRNVPPKFGGSCADHLAKTLDRCASLEYPHAIAISIMRINLFLIIA
jgi:hypothetical protein